MSHIALYRSWRPQRFKDMVGQQHIVHTLQNAIREQRVSHAYLFSGPRGTGKTSAAKIMAKALNCEQGPSVEPCNECAACKGITAGRIMDVVEIDAASNRGIDEIRDLREKVRFAPSEVKYKVYIIDEVHMLTTEAFNALLKTLEEPPAHVVFILATTEPHKLLPTIISRCQRFDFRQVAHEDQVEHLKQICQEEHMAAEEAALAYIARLSEGGMRDAISLLEQVAAFAEGEITLEAAVDVTGGLAAEQFYELAEAVRERNVAGLLPMVEKLMQAGKSPDKCLENLSLYFRDLLLLKLAPEGTAVTERITDRSRFVAMAASFETERLFAMIDALGKYQVELRHAAQAQLVFEVALMKLCTMTASSDAAPAASAERTVASAAAMAMPSDAAFSGADELQRLRQQVKLLEERMQELQQQVASGVAAGTQSPPRRQSSGPPREGRPGFGAASKTVSRAVVKLPPFLAARTSTDSETIRSRWSDLLQRVHETKLTLNAWLKNGEPVAVAEDQVLVAFKNAIHRETTEKPDHRQIIETSLEQVFGRPLRFVTVMLSEWEVGLKDGGSAPSPAANGSAASQGMQARPQASAVPVQQASGAAVQSTSRSNGAVGGSGDRMQGEPALFMGAPPPEQDDNAMAPPDAMYSRQQEQAASPQQAVVDEALSLFGSELVVIKDQE